MADDEICWSPLCRGTQRQFPPKRFETIQSTFRSLEMYFKWRKKIDICSVTLGQLESFRNYKGFSIIFPKILVVTKVIVFLIPLCSAFSSPKILDFLSLQKMD